VSAEGGANLEDQVGGEDVPERPASMFTPDDVEDQRNEHAPQLGSHSGLMIPAQAKRSRKRRSSRGTNMSEANTSRSRRTS
jgi:hypothetical protein